MSSPNRSTSDIEDAFSSMNILNYTSVSSDYFPASSGSTIVPPSMSDSRDFFPPKEISSPEGAKTPVKSPNPMSTSSSVGSSSPVRSTTSPPNYLFNESIFAELDNSLWIISRPLGSKPVPEEFNMPPKRTSTSAAPAMTQDAIRQLVADSVAIALKAQAANLANTDNTNKNTRTSGTPVARKGINDHKRKIEDRGNTTTNNNYPKHNNNNHSNNHINKNNYPDNHNKNNHNNDSPQKRASKKTRSLLCT
ncbi:hypothetical protein Tco_1153815 [Tanacetum coccineum]